MATKAADILGLNRTAKIPSKWAEHYQRLCAERDRLSARDVSATETPKVKMDDMADAASDESERSLSLVTATATHDIIHEVLAAIRRIERGTYGICELTGKPIETPRLQAIPWTRYSLEGQRELENSGNGRRLALPSLHSLAEAETSSEPSAEAEEEGE
jgi:RNA polymerase-binding transcription factor DksA